MCSSDLQRAVPRACVRPLELIWALSPQGDRIASIAFIADSYRLLIDDMATGGRVTITQPKDARLREGMKVRVEGSGENARVVPR